MAECDKAAQLDPGQAGQCYFNEGAILTNQGKVDEANLAFDKAIAADPTRAEAYYQKGINLLGKATLGKDGKMIPVPGTAEALNKYLELAPDGKNAPGRQRSARLHRSPCPDHLRRPKKQEVVCPNALRKTCCNRRMA